MYYVKTILIALVLRDIKMNQFFFHVRALFGNCPIKSKYYRGLGTNQGCKWTEGLKLIRICEDYPHSSCT